MKLLILSDAHGNTDAVMHMKDEAAKADIVIFGGDFADVEAHIDGMPVLTALDTIHDTVFAVLGNHDKPDFKEQLEAKDMCADAAVSHFERLIIAGAGGSTKFQNNSPNERDEDDIISDFSLLESAYDDSPETQKDGWNNLVMIMHNPPADTVTDTIAGGIHVGSAKLRALIEKYQPLLVVCGHIHESAGIQKIGQTTVINPGSLGQHKYAVVELSGGVKSPFVIEKAELKSF